MSSVFKYKIAAMALGLSVLAFLVWYFHVIVFYVLGAAVLSLLGKPIVGLLMRIRVGEWRFPKWAAAAIALLALLVGIGSLFVLFVPVVVDKFSFLASFSPDELSAMLRIPFENLEHWIHTTFPSSNISISEMLTAKLEPLLNSAFIQNAVGSFVALTIDILIAVFSISFIAYFFLKDDTLFGDGVVMLFPKRYEEGILRAMSSSTKLLARYFIGLCIESLIKMVIITLSMYIIGFDFSTAMMMGLITGVLNVIPYIGPIIGGVFALGIAAVSPVSGVELSSIVFEMSIVLVVFQLFDNIILQPYIYSSSVRAHALEIFLVILMAGYIAGITGMLLAIPAYTVLRVFAKEFLNNIRVVQKLTQKI